ncbi:PR-1-like protein [Aspergillus heteromorphus CBS 117.55]|uniref:PR-1-like protein n=1 Tax=Aspergillus heteromorphus CBS 117.55 TaxID=1448321 RepID=A0A317WP92_9EURO|nr:PR-1-like protein [Aspergillus heteromorphus CBS 117.55]PWY86917.1 PR-1-like protein [Aspergillus heteromorphus CBS 117.55]
MILYRRFSISTVIPPLLLLSAISLAEQTTVVITLAPTAPHPPSYTSEQTFQDAVLSVSNAYRKAHNATHLLWNETLTTYAQNWADGCKWQHSHGPYGENLAFGYPNASAAVTAWGDEGLEYNFQEPTGFTEETGHFSQLVWRATTDVGCAAVNCGYDETKNGSGSYERPQGWYVVCEYAPPGNVMGGNKLLGDKEFFKINVQASSTYSGPYETGSATGSGTTATASSSGAGARERKTGLLGLIVVVGWVVLG